jgi:hypothetical protein
MTDYGSVFTALGNVVRASASPAQGWTAILDETGRHGAVPPEPLPPGTGFIYFGLFEAWDEETGDPVAGFYIAGGPDDDAELALAEGRLPYFPDARHFISPLLDAVHAAPERGDYDPTLMRYALEFAAAALLARHATQGLLDEYTLVVGFDDGDRDVIRRPENGGD